MESIPEKSVDLILCDLPYGTTACAWDSVIPFDRIWKEYKRICRGVIVLTASQPFTTMLAASNIGGFRYQFIWEKERPSNPQLAKKQPLKMHEDILVFYEKFKTYNPQGVVEIPESERRVQNPERNSLGHCTRKPYIQTQTNYPRSILKFPSERGLHPTQKPVALMEYLIRTYSNPGDTVLDNCMGSGTTGVACVKTNRDFIGIEKDEGYFQIANKRIDDTYQQVVH
jgi:site-specific DNA-methyltransferase (adenine-specific)